MQLHWTVDALDDIQRLYDFIKPHNPKAAAKIAQQLVRAPQMLLEYPRIGEQMFRFYPREIRCLLVDIYEIRYAIQHDNIFCASGIAGKRTHNIVLTNFYIFAAMPA